MHAKVCGSGFRVCGLWFVVSVFLNIFYLAANYWFNVVVVKVRVTLFVC